MSRFIRSTGAAVICSLSLLASTSAFAQHYHHQQKPGYPAYPSGDFHGVGIHQGHNHFNQAMPYPGMTSGTFGSLGHIDELAANVRYLANHITFDMYYNYQFNPGFQQIYAKCYAFRNLAYTIHDMEHLGTHVEMTAAINEMDALFHSLEHDIAGWQRFHRLQIGQGDLRYKMELLEDMMHHLMNDAGVRSQFLIDSGAAVPAVPPTGGVVPSQPVTPLQQVIPMQQVVPGPGGQFPSLPGQG